MRSIIPKVGRAALIALVSLLSVALLFALLEGTASLLFIGNEIIRTPGVPEHTHAEHDELLGWVNRPNVFLADFYGSGLHVRTNAQRFRNSQDFTRKVPVGKIRIVCSGDSFTFGYGVDNEDAWCQRLVAFDLRLETLNMGLGGYGVDQAYLWYLRDGAPFDHQLHIFAFLTDDFRRMRSDRFMGYGKPLLAVRNDSLVVANRPVPRTSWFSHQRALHAETVARLNVVRLAQKLLRLDKSNPGEQTLESQRLRDIAARIFTDLRSANEVKGSRLVLVYFPGVWDYKRAEDTDDWRRFVKGEATRLGVDFVDLVEEIRRVPPTEVDRLYASNLHFSVAGNEWAAEVLHRRLSPLLDTLTTGARVETARAR